MKSKATETPQLSLWAWRIVVNQFVEKLNDLGRAHAYHVNNKDDEKIKETNREIRETEMVLNELYGYDSEEAQS